MFLPGRNSLYDDNEDILRRMDRDYTSSITMNQSYWGEADTDFRFIAGDQNVWSDYYGNLPVHQRKTFNFNRIRRVVEMVSGYQRKNRKSTIVTPVENADQKTADQFTKVMFWMGQHQNVLETISDAFYGALVAGMNLLQVWMDYREDPVNGTIRVDNCSYNTFLIDPFFRKADLSDCNFIWKRNYLKRNEVLSLLPDKYDEVMSLQSNNRDGKFQFMPENYNMEYTDLMIYDEYYYRDYRKQRVLVDPSGAKFEWTADNDDALREFLTLYPQVQMVDQIIPTVKLAIVVNNNVMYDGPNPMGIDQYPFVSVMSYYEPQIPYFPIRVQGMVRGLRDAQYLYNRRKVVELDILESQINSGWKYKAGALVNPDDVFLSGQGRGLALKDSAQMTDVERIQAPQVPPSMIELSRILGEEIQQISGVNEELLGSATDDKAGILAQMRQGGGLMTLQRLFDQLDRSQKLLGNIILRLVQTNFTPGKIQQITNEQPTQPFYSKFFGRYDAAIEEGFNTSTQKQLQFAQLLSLREAGVPIPAEELIRAATVQNKDQLVESIQQQQQAQEQAQQMQMQLEMQKLQAEAEKTSAQALADRGLGIERLSRINENEALATERKAEAVKDRELGILHLAKAIKELQSIELGQLKEALTIDSMLRNEAEVDTATQQAAQSLNLDEQPASFNEEPNPPRLQGLGMPQEPDGLG